MAWTSESVKENTPPKKVHVYLKRLLKIAIIIAPLPLCYALFQALLANPHHTKSQVWIAIAGIIVALGLMTWGTIAIVLWIEENLQVNDKNKN